MPTSGGERSGGKRSSGYLESIVPDGGTALFAPVSFSLQRAGAEIYRPGQN